MNQTFNKLKFFFTEGHQRSIKAKKNILASFLLKGGSICISLILVPLTINYVSPTHYGIWLTLSSIIMWFSFFDIGLGNGLKNKLALALAEGNNYLVKIYVSTTYVLLGIISLFIYIVFTSVNHLLDWTKILNTSSAFTDELNTVVLIVFSVFVLQFVLQLINVIFEATQNSKLSALNGFLGNLLSLIVIATLTQFTQGSLLYLSLSMTLSPLFVLGIFTVIQFNRGLRDFRPSFKYVKFEHAKEIINLGIKFFIIQLGLIFFYNANNVIIAQVVGPTAVTPYNVAFKYFGVITMVSSIIMVPLWSAFTEANARHDIAWIKSTIRRLEMICFALCILSLFMLVISSYVIELWVGDQINVPFNLTAILAVYTIINSFRTIYTFYLNGIGKIHIQLLIVSMSGLLNIPLAFYLGKLYGATGVILSTTILCFLCGLIELTQYKKLINKSASGIWNK